MPEFICMLCVQDLKSAVKFKEKCEESDRILNCEFEVKIETDCLGNPTKNDSKNVYDETSTDSHFSDGCNDSSKNDKIFKPYEIISQEFENNGNKQKLTVYKCITCSRPELNSAKIQQHNCNTDIDYDLDVFKCEKCTQIIISQNCYEEHIQTHEEVKCDECDKVLSKKEELSKHFSTEHCEINETQTKSICLQCHICNRKCKTKRLLKIHVKNHSNERKCICLECKKTFTNKADLKIHFALHDTVKVYKCQKCDKKFARKSILDNHERSHTISDESIPITAQAKNKDEKHQCETCGKFFSHRAYLVRHMKIHNDDKPHECKECGKRFIKNGDLVTHIRVHTGEKPFTCEECGISFRQQGNLREHVKRMHRRDEYIPVKKFECHICYKKCRNRSTLKGHIETHSGERNYPCTECPKAFMTKMDLRRHLRLHERQKAIEAGTYVVEKKHGCEKCGKSFVFRCDLLRHMKRHNGDKQHECRECGKRFVLNIELTSHMRVHTGEKPFTCDECGVSFAQKYNLKTHIMRIHRKHMRINNEKSFQCDICSNTFKEIRYLKAHMRMHTLGRTLPCPECDKAFVNKSSLTQHIKKHEKQKAIEAGTYVEPVKHQCESCGKFFNYRYELVKHMKRHNGDKQHVCQQCGKRFVSNPELVIHMRVHTGEKPFTCEECGLSFAQQGNYSSHVKRIHRREESKQMDDKKFQCHICYNRFKSVRYLRTHIRMHTGERNYPCTECEKAFVTKTALNRHIKRHEKQKIIEPNLYIEPVKYPCLFNMG